MIEGKRINQKLNHLLQITYTYITFLYSLLQVLDLILLLLSIARGLRFHIDLLGVFQSFFFLDLKLDIQEFFCGGRITYKAQALFQKFRAIRISFQFFEQLRGRDGLLLDELAGFFDLVRVNVLAVVPFEHVVALVSIRVELATLVNFSIFFSFSLFYHPKR